ncbi:putative MFS sugar transporter [Exophiala viscosa]|uniref:putative MFS sugar transporter n=1 Tax=Exophiala viscosa TaxID=2486360 RepID=UPI00219355A4|nr:putative MFS sugar transporter [Exophiala viscosa]
MPSYKMFGTGHSLRLAISVACDMAFILFGYDQGVFGGVVSNEHFCNGLDHCEYPGYNSANIVGAALQTSAKSTPHMMIGRYITGIGTGIETSTVPMYQAELCEASKRGRLLCSEVFFVAFGIVVAYFFNYGMAYVGKENPGNCPWDFRLLLVFGLPESPRYCYKLGRNEEALRILCEVYEKSPDDPMIVQAQQDVLEVIAMETEHGQYKWRNIFKADKVKTGRRVLLAYGIQFMQQWTGINIVVYFISTVLQVNVGLSRQLSLVLGGCINLTFMIGSLFPTFFIDRYGRRRPLMWGFGGLGISMLLIAVLLSFNGHANEHATSSAAVAFFFSYMLAFGMSLNCIPWCYGPEILPLHARAKGGAIGISSNWLWNFVVVEITPTIIEHLQWKAYLIFTVTNLAFIPVVYFFYPETAQLTLEEVDLVFLDGGDSAVKKSLNMVQARKTYGRRESMILHPEIRTEAQEEPASHIEVK